MKLQGGQFLSLEQIQDQYLNQKNRTGQTAGGESTSFQSILDQVSGKQQTDTLSEVKFSKHAAGRLSNRNIELTDSQLKRLSEGTKKAGQKGIQDSLVIMDNLAFIINVPSSTVITAMDQNDTKENIFTNIDGAVII